MLSVYGGGGLIDIIIPSSLLPPTPPCSCFSTCDDDSRASFENSIPRWVTVASSPWYGYLSAVYRGPVALPFELHSLNFWYHNDELWESTHATVEWPMSSCNWSGVATMWADRDAQMAIGVNHLRTSAGTRMVPTLKTTCEHALCSRWFALEGRQTSSRRTASRGGSLLMLNVRSRSSRGVLTILPEGPNQAVKNNSWLEVIRVSAVAERGMGTGCWFWGARGSGIWLNTRRVVSYPTKITKLGEQFTLPWARQRNISESALRAGMPKRQAFSKEIQSHFPVGFPSLLKDKWVYAAHELGIDTVRGGPEVIVTANECVLDPNKPVTACAPIGVELRAGWNAKLPCNCRNTNSTVAECES